MLSLDPPLKVRQKVGKAIKKLRIDRGISQADLADRADLSVSYLSQVERGIRSLPTNRLAAIADSLGTDLKGLFKYAKNDEPDPWMYLLIKTAVFAEEIELAKNTLKQETRTSKSAVTKR